jgi:pimeloyl-ACP methyl ester carboxylesterase/DNA-binding CsgD family transcriptional regulator
MDDRIRQRTRYLVTPDGVKLAWAEAGTGPALVKASNWLTHLEYDLESPVWRHWIRFFAGHSRFIRYDERGCGMTDWNVPGLATFSGWADDLEAVVAAAAPAEPFALLGISQGAPMCAAYAAAHPEQVSALILYGGYARGWAVREQPEAARVYSAIMDLVRVGWGKGNAAFREVFTSRFIPGGSRAQLDWFNELCRKTTTGDNAADMLLSRSHLEVSSLLGQVRAPTLVLHARDDGVTPIAEGRFLASHIPGAEFVELESRNHVLLEEEPAWGRFCGAVSEFLGWGSALVCGREAAVFAALTARERGILTLITEGLSNADIADRLGISEKTVRNHVSNLFDKLGVDSRAQAMVFARDHRFGG